ncbi:casparian strip membrane protein 1 [Phtheirospermum japonicum]|uniref:CASP-like protein n=1 Tax=Phtheirospermum japonicum TaxID=374723 RepID=A0A830BRF1_9LAMI|nr:casparian strip membrane protein 1 [Phtheirospermum japonicum]
MGGLELGAKKTGVSRGVAVMDFILRLVAIIATLASAIAMGTTNQSLSFFTQFIRFRAKYSDLPTFTFFVVANSIASAYLILSLALSIFHIMKSGAQKSRAMLALLSAGASAAAAIVYLAHKGNTRTNWFAICQQFNSFCERTSASLIGSFGGMIVLILLILMSATSLSRP